MPDKTNHKDTKAQGGKAIRANIPRAAGFAPIPPLVGMLKSKFSFLVEMGKIGCEAAVGAGLLRPALFFRIRGGEVNYLETKGIFYWR